MSGLLEKLGSSLRAFVLEVDVRREKRPLNYIRSLKREIEGLGYEVIRILEDTKSKIYHIHVRK